MPDFGKLLGQIPLEQGKISAPLFWIFWCVAAGLMARQDLALSHGYSNATGALFALALLADGAIWVMAAEKSGYKGLKRWLPQ